MTYMKVPNCTVNTCLSTPEGDLTHVMSPLGIILKAVQELDSGDIINPSLMGL